MTNFATTLDPMSLQSRKAGKVANNTTVERSESGYTVRYHGNVVAKIETWEVTVTNAGWTSPTTRIRVNQVLSDNRIPFYVAQRNHVEYLFSRNDHKAAREFDSATFTMVAGEWQLTD